RGAWATGAETALLSTTGATAAAIDRINVERMRTASLVAANADVRAALSDPDHANRADVLEALSQYAGSNPGYTAVYVIDAAGLARFSSDPAIEGQVLDYRPYFQEALRGSSYTSDLTVGVTSGQPAVYY